MDFVWYADCKTKQEKEERRKELLGYRRAYEELAAVLTKRFPDEVTPDYDKPGWEGHLAHELGAKGMLQKILKLIDIKE